MKDNGVAFILRQPMALTALLSGIPARYRVEAGAAAEETICYYDTFDWRLYVKKLLCLRLGKRRHRLIDFGGGVVAEVDKAGRQRFFPRDFAGSEFGEKLALAADGRALLPQLTLLRQSQPFRVFNRDQKIVLTGTLHGNHLVLPNGRSKPVDGSLQVLGMRGYEKVLSSVADLLRAQDCEQGEFEESALRCGLEALGRRPLDYSSHFFMPLESSEAIVQTARKIFLRLLEGLERNIPGIIDDIDPEFLHDFRVALRRSRSLLGSMKKLLPAEDVAFFQQEFQKIGLITGPVRDLDVYLLDKHVYHSLLPEGLQEGLAVFFSELSARRVGELRKLKRFFRSKGSIQFLTRWRRYVEDSLVQAASAAGNEPAQEVAAKAIRKRLHCILKQGAAIDPLSSDEALHSLRIQAKKLRYLLEFYRSLFPEAEMELLIKSLKKLQDNLGNFNDLTVQQKMLGHYQGELAGGEPVAAMKVAAALGGLITHLHDEQSNVRQKFELTFDQFASRENRRLFDLFFEKAAGSKKHSR